MFLAVSSIIIGLVVGLFTAIIFKYIPKLNDQPVKECAMLFTLSYLSYIIAEYCECSGIISLFSCGFTLSHYAYHNLSKESKKGTLISSETAAMLAESFLYVYLGMSSLSVKKEQIFPSLILFTLFATVVARMISVLIPMLFLKLIYRSKFKLSLGEVFLIGIGGIIRGAIAFGLCFKIETPSHKIL
jgi:sodium/hydrogen exchanger-like protein 6/7